jgi:hypothetical protein
MTAKTFSAKLEEILGLIEPALAGIEQGGGQAELVRLQTLLGDLLINCMRLLERNPGIEAAAADLYVAATALVKYSTLGLHPLARHQRLFREAHQRFRDRLVSARPSEHGTAIVWRHHELLLSA